MNKKICSCCKESKNVDEFHFKKTENRYHSWCKSCVYKCQKNRWKERKKKAVDLLGGKCQICGYNKNIFCLDFHHINPELKDVDWKKLKLRSWKKIIEELKKCVLLCRNCHGEIHNPDSFFECDGYDNIALNKEITTVLTNKFVLKSTGVCPSCGEETYGTKYCSTKCASFVRRKVQRPSREDLENLIRNSNYCKIGRQYGVSDKAVRKWAKSYGII